MVYCIIVNWYLGIFALREYSEICGLLIFGPPKLKRKVNVTLSIDSYRFRFVPQLSFSVPLRKNMPAKIMSAKMCRTLGNIYYRAPALMLIPIDVLIRLKEAQVD